jgi:hypothetical protein
MSNMLLQARRADTKGVFYFTTFEQVTTQSLLFEPIWRRVDRNEPIPLLIIE